MPKGKTKTGTPESATKLFAPSPSQEAALAKEELTFENIQDPESRRNAAQDRILRIFDTLTHHPDLIDSAIYTKEARELMRIPVDYDDPKGGLSHYLSLCSLQLAIDTSIAEEMKGAAAFEETTDDISIITLDELSHDSQYPDNFLHQGICNLRGKQIGVRQSVINAKAAENRFDIAATARTASKALEQKYNTYDPSRPYQPQMDSFVAVFGASFVHGIILHCGQGAYARYISSVISDSEHRMDSTRYLTPEQHGAACNMLSNALDRYVISNNNANDISRQFNRINREKGHEDAGLGDKLKALVEIGNTLHQSLTLEEKVGRFRDVRFREFTYTENAGRKTKSIFETGDAFLIRLLDMQSELNAGSDGDQLVISDEEVVLSFRQQVTSRGIGFGTQDIYDRLLNEELLRHIAENRRFEDKHKAITTTISGLTNKLKAIKSMAKDQGAGR